jgi:rhamnosyltransferase
VHRAAPVRAELAASRQVMSVGSPRASVIIRTKDSARTLPGALASVRSQTISCEVVVVDSGSRDATLSIARTGADHVLQLPAERFSFGRALNVGAGAAGGPIHFALSSHSVPPDEHWIERSLAKYDRADVAATNGALRAPGSSQPLTATFFQTLADASRYPFWGFSNTGSSWRATVWAEHPFDEALPACEDKEWGLRVLRAGWVIAFDPLLCVSDAHRTEHGLRHLYRRTRREFEALGALCAGRPPTFADFLCEWLVELDTEGPLRRARRRLNPIRMTELLAKQRGLRASRSLESALGDAQPVDRRLLAGRRIR